MGEMPWKYHIAKKKKSIDVSKTGLIFCKHFFSFDFGFEMWPVHVFIIFILTFETSFFDSVAFVDINIKASDQLNSLIP